MLKKIVYTLFSITFLMHAYSCNNDAEVNPSNNNLFVGIWEISGTIDGYFRKITITFNEDMTYKLEDYFEQNSPPTANSEGTYSYTETMLTMINDDESETTEYEFIDNNTLKFTFNYDDGTTSTSVYERK